MSNKQEKSEIGLGIRFTKSEKDVLVSAAKIKGFKKPSTFAREAIMAFSEHVIEDYIEKEPLDERAIERFNKKLEKYKK